ncbi:DUF3596 domain-containing protein [Serratia plymuthica]|uniref:site-specific integrase n=1 Tax=Serratia plymuthica TaxID=82996 RepID=UPI0019285EDB|nr:site-specific integrase [Serratia plymuthica]MBL3522801.1 DUF3596 domain-containing protein [Serratia plymuthica]
MKAYPTGVENHGGTLRIWFLFDGRRVRENLGIPDTPKNRKAAGELRTSVCYEIKTGNFSYENRFPNSRNIVHRTDRENITVMGIIKKWLNLKEMEVSKGTLYRYSSHCGVTASYLNPDRKINEIRQEDILLARKKMLTEPQQPKRHEKRKSVRHGRAVPTVNSYMFCMRAIFEFAVANGYIDKNPFEGVSPLKKQRPNPDPLTGEEYKRVIDSCASQQMRNMLTLAINTGLRHGELYALAWEDLDTKNWTISINRNLALKDHFTLPKTDAGLRTIQLTTVAIEAIKSQMALTRLSTTHSVTVNLREYGKKRIDDCTFIFSPRITARNGTSADWYKPGAFNSAWTVILRKAGVRHRKSYETRHTFACWALSCGANPNFVAHQMGHSSAQMLYNVYGKWMTENNDHQVSILNASFSQNAPQVPHQQTSNS